MIGGDLPQGLVFQLDLLQGGRRSLLPGQNGPAEFVVQQGHFACFFVMILLGIPDGHEWYQSSIKSHIDGPCGFAT